MTMSLTLKFLVLAVLTFFENVFLFCISGFFDVKNIIYLHTTSGALSYVVSQS